MWCDSEPSQVQFAQVQSVPVPALYAVAGFLTTTGSIRNALVFPPAFLGLDLSKVLKSTFAIVAQNDNAPNYKTGLDQKTNNRRILNISCYLKLLFQRI